MALESICLSSLKLHLVSLSRWPATSSDRSVVKGVVIITIAVVSWSRLVCHRASLALHEAETPFTELTRPLQSRLVLCGADSSFV